MIRLVVLFVLFLLKFKVMTRTEIFAPIFLRMMGKNSFLDELNALYILLGGSLFLTISNVYHYDLYVKKKDKIILISALIAMGVNFCMNLILIPRFELLGAAAATLSSFLVLLVIKGFISNKTVLHDNS